MGVRPLSQSFTERPGIGPAGEEAQLTVVTGEITATVYGQTRTLSPTSGQSVFYPLAWVGPLAPYNAPPASFRLRSTLPVNWRYAANGVVVDSAGAGPLLSVYGPITCGAPTGGTPIAVSDAGASGYQYDPLTMTWQFNWKRMGLGAGCYYFTVTNSAARQTDGPFPIRLE